MKLTTGLAELIALVFSGAAIGHGIATTQLGYPALESFGFWGGGLGIVFAGLSINGQSAGKGEWTG